MAVAILPAQANANLQHERDVYKKALQALKKNNRNLFQQYADQLVDYPLYQYLVYEELRSRISSATNQDIDQFLANYEDGPLATRLRLTWLNQLQRKNHAKSFLKYYKNEESAALQCYFLHSKIKLSQFEENKPRYLNQIRDIWLVGKSQPKQCDPVFDWFDRQGYLTTELIWERFELAMSSKRVRLARYLAKKLSASEKKRADLWLQVHSNPQSKLRSNALAKDDHINRKIIVHGIERLARKDLTAAHNLWLDLKDDYAFGSDLHDEVDRSLALRAAYRHDDRAKTWMYQLPKQVFDPATAMWRIRSAIRDMDWELVLRGIAMLNEEEKSEPQWQYWKARALAEKGLRADADALYQSISSERSYYGFLASDKLSTTYSIVDAPVLYDASELEKIENTPAIIRSRELLFVEQYSDARREWNFATKNYSKKQLQVAASLAHQWQWHDYAIRTIAKGRYFDDLGIRFPTSFGNQVDKYSSKRNLQPEFIYAIIRRESALNPHARSPVGARGLMQLMPATAKQVAKQLKLRTPTRQDLYTPGININLGSKYIADMLKKFDGHRALASAAYNAGPHRVKAWLPENRVLPADVWVDTIPFTETREYVRAILAYTALFEWKRQQTPTRLSAHLTPVTP